MQYKHTNVREAVRSSLSSASEVITMLNRCEKHENEEEGKTQQETPCSKSLKATHIRTTPRSRP